MKSRAFTLIEMMVIVAIISLFAALIVPKLVTMQNARDQRSKLEAILRLPAEAEVRARTDGKTVKLSYESGNGELKLSQGDDPVKALSLGDEVSISSVTLDDKDRQDQDVKFYEDGTADAATLQVRTGQIERFLRIDKDGSARWVDQPPQPSDDRWEAGEIEKRAGA